MACEGWSRRLVVVIVSAACLLVICSAMPSKEPRFDTSITEFNNMRTCYTSEVCKTEFQPRFWCRCPKWYWCRSPGRYYHAYCSMSTSGTVWIQPGGLRPEDALY